MKPVIGEDLGHSAAKAVAFSGAARFQVCFPAVVTPAITLSDEAAAAAAETDTVEVGGRRFFVGNTAVQQGGANSVTGLSKEWIDSIEYQALHAAVVKKLAAQGLADAKDALVVAGLPSQYYRQQREALATRLRACGATDVLVQPQPAGPYYGIMFTKDGAPAGTRKMADESWAVIDVGRYTSDFYLVERGVRIDLVLQSADGVGLAIQHVQRLIEENHKIVIDALEADEVLRTQKVMNFNKVIDVSKEVILSTSFLVDQVQDKARNLLSHHARKLNGIILAGGGAPIVYKTLKNNWPNAMMASDPRMAIAEGLARYGRSYQRALAAARRTATH